MLDFCSNSEAYDYILGQRRPVSNQIATYSCLEALTVLQTRFSSFALLAGHPRMPGQNRARRYIHRRLARRYSAGISSMEMPVEERWQAEGFRRLPPRSRTPDWYSAIWKRCRGGSDVAAATRSLPCARLEETRAQKTVPTLVLILPIGKPSVQIGVGAIDRGRSFLGRRPEKLGRPACGPGRRCILPWWQDCGA
jgi:hypothetical protein